MDKELFLQHVANAYDKAELKHEGIFLFHFFGFQFSYDDEQRMCRIECPVSEQMLNPMGMVHGGIYTFLADTAMGHLNKRYKEAAYVSLELKTSYTKGTNSGRLIAKARFVREGYKIVFTECTIENEAGEILSVTTGTFYRIEK